MTMLPSIAAPPQHLGRRKTGGAAADDDDVAPAHPPLAARRAAFGCVAFLAHEDAAVALLDLPALDRTQGRRAQGLAGAQIEAGVMPGAAHCLADHEAVGERPVVVAAMSADGEHIGAAAHQQNLLVADMPGETAIDEIG